MKATQGNHATDTSDNRNNWITGISTVRAIADNLVSLLQDKVLESPDKPYSMGSAAEQAIQKTTSKVEVPNDFINVVNQGLTAIVDRTSKGKRIKNHPLFPIAIGIIAIADTAVALEMARQDWERNKKIGTYPQVAAFASLAATAVAVPAMVDGVKQMFKK